MQIRRIRRQQGRSVSSPFLWLGALTAVAFSGACSGGLPPKSLREPGVEISDWTPTKDLVLQVEGLGPVQAIHVGGDQSEFLAVGNGRFCRASMSDSEPQCAQPEAGLSGLQVVRDGRGEPYAIVGSGLWGKPSAASLDLNGRLIWRYDGGYDAMGRAAYVDDGDTPLVMLGNEFDSVLVFDFESGAILRRETPARVIGSGDFTGDGRHEVLLGRDETSFALVNGMGTDLAELTVSLDYWYEPVLTTTGDPFLVLSAGSVLDVHDTQLARQRRFDALGAESPLHVEAAAFLGKGPSAPFVAVFKGRGGWHVSVLYVFSETGELVYKEILAGDYQSIAPVEGGEGFTFLLGGRNEVWRYHF